MPFIKRWRTPNPEEWQKLLSGTDRFVKVKGQWIEVDPEKLQMVLSRWEGLQNAAKDGLSMAESLRLLAGADLAYLRPTNWTKLEEHDWSTVVAGDWLRDLLDQLKNPTTEQEQFVDGTLSQYLRASLRPYQCAGLRWLWLLYQIAAAA